MAAILSAGPALKQASPTIDVDVISPEEALSIFDKANNGDKRCLEAIKSLSEKELFRFYLKAFVPFVERSNRLHAFQPDFDMPH